MSEYDLKKHLEDLVDHVAALKEQTASLVSQRERERAWLGMGMDGRVVGLCRVLLTCCLGVVASSDCVGCC